MEGERREKRSDSENCAFETEKVVKALIFGMKEHVSTGSELHPSNSDESIGEKGQKGEKKRRRRRGRRQGWFKI